MSVKLDNPARRELEACKDLWALKDLRELPGLLELPEPLAQLDLPGRWEPVGSSDLLVQRVRWDRPDRSERLEQLEQLDCRDLLVQLVQVERTVGMEQPVLPVNQVPLEVLVLPVRVDHLVSLEPQDLQVLLDCQVLPALLVPSDLWVSPELQEVLDQSAPLVPKVHQESRVHLEQ